MQNKLNQLRTILGELSDLQSAAGLLSWDQQTYMPPGGAPGRGATIATLRSLAHQKLTSTEMGNLLDELQPWKETLDPDSDDARLIKVARHNFDKATKVPTTWIAENAQTVALAQQAWQEARLENSFAKFEPHLEKVIDLRRRYAEFFYPYEHVYDPLLDGFELGLKTAEVKAIFSSLRPQQVALIQKLTAQPPIDDSFLHQAFDPTKQWDFGVAVVTKFGYDWKRGRQDKSAHPFTQGINIDDVRITTRVNPNFLNPALFGTMHESGHAMYGQGIDNAYARTPLAGGASLSIHESQSRMWENFVGRSLAFWEYFYPQLQKTFPDQLSHIDLKTFYKGINKVQPSIIRVEADEATYNLHIMLRLELEIALIEGNLSIKELPEVWNSRMVEYLGIAPPNDADGVLQDIHWSIGLVGYFSTYALGNLVAAQLWERIAIDIPDLYDQFRQGNYASLLGWLRHNIHQHGAKFEPQELVQRVTGSKIDPAPYLRYLQTKYNQVYDL